MGVVHLLEMSRSLEEYTGYGGGSGSLSGVYESPSSLVDKSLSMSVAPSAILPPGSSRKCRENSPAFAVFQVLSTQNNQHTKMAYSWILYVGSYRFPSLLLIQLIENKTATMI